MEAGRLAALPDFLIFSQLEDARAVAALINHPDIGVNDTPVFLLNEYIVELNPANFNILNQILN